MTSSLEIASLLYKGEQQRWLDRRQVERLARDLTPLCRRRLYERIRVHGIEIHDAEAARERHRIAIR